jgi:hypothetical protein
MTEITITLADPAEFARYARAHASQIHPAWKDRAAQFAAIADSIDEQVASEPTAEQIAVKEAQHKGWLLGYTEAWNNATNGDLPSRPPLDAAGNPWTEEKVKPAVEEPEDFGSVVRAAAPDWTTRPLLWQKTPAAGKHYWESETGVIEVWSELTNVEVLRVGIGTESSTPHSDDYLEGRQDIAGAIRQDIAALRAEAITAERKDAYDKALAAVTARLGDS